MDRGDLTVTQVTDFVFKLQIVFWIAVISENVMSADHKIQKENYASRSADIFLLSLYFFFFFALKMSVAE